MMFVGAAAAADFVRDVGAHELGRRRIAEDALQDRRARFVGGWFAFAPGGRVAHAGISTVDPSVPLVGYGY